jgi:sec-independent protein translocase protein TatB
MSFSETIFLFLLALLVFGPKKLPEIARQVGKALNELKRASNEFKAQIEAEISQLDFEERRKQQEENRILPAGEPPEDPIPASQTASEAGPLPDSTSPLPVASSPAEKPSNA